MEQPSGPDYNTHHSDTNGLLMLGPPKPKAYIFPSKAIAIQPVNPILNFTPGQAVKAWSQQAPLCTPNGNRE